MAQNTVSGEPSGWDRCQFSTEPTTANGEGCSRRLRRAASPAHLCLVYLVLLRGRRGSLRPCESHDAHRRRDPSSHQSLLGWVNHQTTRLPQCGQMASDIGFFLPHSGQDTSFPLGLAIMYANSPKSPNRSTIINHAPGLVPRA